VKSSIACLFENPARKHKVIGKRKYRTKTDFGLNPFQFPVLADLSKQAVRK